MERRAFVRGCVGLVLCPALSAARASPDPLHAALARMRVLFADPGPARLIGTRFLERHGERPDLGRLFADAGLDPAWPSERMRRALSARRVEDFEVGCTVELDGWVLARSEVAVAALVSLS